MGAVTGLADAPPKEALEAWHSFQERVHCGNFVVTQSAWVDGKSTASDFEIAFAREDERVVYRQGKMASESGDGATLKIRSDKGNFGLERPAKSDQWMLAFAEPLDSNRGKGLIPTTAMEVLLSLPIRVFGTNLSKMGESSEVEFKDWEVFLDSEGKEMVKFLVVANEDRVLRIPPGEFRFVVDPENHYRIANAEYRVSNGTKYFIKMSYGDMAHSFPDQEEVTAIDPNGKEIKRDIYTVKEISFEPPPAEIFELSHYGIDDVKFSTSGPAYTWIYALCILVGSTCFAGYLWFRRNTG